MEHLGFKIEVEWLWNEDKQSRFEDFIITHHHLIHMFVFVLCRESRYFEDIVKQAGAELGQAQLKLGLNCN